MKHHLLVVLEKKSVWHIKLHTGDLKINILFIPMNFFISHDNSKGTDTEHVVNTVSEYRPPC